MSRHPTMIEQFRSFCFRNYATDFEQAIEYFSVFGGMGWNVNVKTPIETIIEKKVLDNYKYIHGEITNITNGRPIYHKLLTALAKGDRRAHSAFRNIDVERSEGEDALDFLVNKGFLIVERSLEAPVETSEEDSSKLLFVNPFMRFWFSAVSPYFKNIKAGDYTEFFERWDHRKQGFSNLIIERLFIESLRFQFADDPLVKLGAYWDKSRDIDLLARTESGRQIAGLCKFAKAKANKTDLKKLQDNCTEAELNIDAFILFSKNKFSNELRKQKSENIALLSMRNLKIIAEDLTDDDLLTSKFKKY